MVMVAFFSQGCRDAFELEWVSLRLYIRGRWLVWTGGSLNQESKMGVLHLHFFAQGYSRLGLAALSTL